MPARSRLTVRPPDNAPLVRRDRDRLAEALRQSREAMNDVERQLASLLATLRAPEGPQAEDVDRLRRASGRASLAMSRLR
jgi:hypothetical protein